MLAELKALVAAHVADEPLRRLVLAILDAHAGPLQRLPATWSAGDSKPPYATATISRSWPRELP